MKFDSISKWFEIFVAVFAACVSGLFLILSLMYGHAETIKDGEVAVFMLFMFYFFSVIAYVIYISNKQDNHWHFGDITMKSFVVNCLFYPGTAILLLGCVLYIYGKPVFIIIKGLALVVHIIVIAVWVLVKLFGKKELKETDLMRIDFISTTAILPLTFVWILYDINYFIWGFALFMGEFLVFQIVIKYKLLKNKEHEEN